MNSKRPFLRGLLIGVGLWLFLALVALGFFGVFPRTMTGWALSFVLGPALLFVFELVGDLVGEAVRRLPGVRRFVGLAEARTSPRAFSGSRVFANLVLSLVLGIPLVALAIWITPRWHSPASHPIKEWLQAQFYGW